MNYDLELNRMVKEVKQEKAKLVCIQLPDGLKSRAKEITDHIRKETAAEVIIWAGSNFGACDLALETSRLGADLLVHFGHAEWEY